MSLEDVQAISVSDLKVVRSSGRDQRVVLDRVSFSVPRAQRGNVVLIAGPNGIGKSTLIDVMTGTLEPERGGVLINGLPPSSARLGVVWQRTSQSLYPWQTTLENIALPWRLQNVRRSDRRSRVRQLCDQFGIQIPLSRRPYELSGGEQQKACILRALASMSALKSTVENDARVLLLDEPCANLSYEASLELLEHLQRIRARSGITIIMISHSPDECVFMADMVVPFRRSPVRVSQTDLIAVTCPYPVPRPIEWIHEPSFREQVALVRTQVVEPSRE